MDPCPSCESPLSLGGTFCKECGYDLDLAVADFQGDGADLPDDEMDDAAYRATLAREGLAGESAASGGLPAWVIGVGVAVGLVVLWMLSPMSLGLTLVVIVAVGVTVVLASLWGASRHGSGGARGEFLCDGCKYNDPRYCSQPERPNARACPEFKSRR